MTALQLLSGWRLGALSRRSEASPVSCIDLLHAAVGNPGACLRQAI